MLVCEETMTQVSGCVNVFKFKESKSQLMAGGKLAGGVGGENN